VLNIVLNNFNNNLIYFNFDRWEWQKLQEKNRVQCLHFQQKKIKKIVKLVVDKGYNFK